MEQIKPFNQTASSIARSVSSSTPIAGFTPAALPTVVSLIPFSAEVESLFSHVILQ